MDQYDRAVALAASKGVRRLEADPPVFRLIRRLGFRMRPPLYLGFGSLFAWNAVLFGVLFVAGMLLLQRDAPIWVPLLASVLGSLIYGVVIAALVRRKARRLELPEWEAI